METTWQIEREILFFHEELYVRKNLQADTRSIGEYGEFNQKRVRFYDPQQMESNNKIETNPLSQIQSFTAFLGDKVQKWFQNQFPVQMSEDYYVSKDGEFAAAVAAAAFSIYSVEEAEAKHRRKMREELEMSRTKWKTRKEDTITRLFSGQDLKNEGETTPRNLTDAGRGAQERVLPISGRPGRSWSSRSMNTEAVDQKQKGIPSKNTRIETKAEGWERVRMEKINKRYEKMKSAVLAWENEKKLKAGLKMEKKKGELEQRRALNQQHYQNKIARIERVAGGARAQAEEERRNKEYQIKQKAKMYDIGSRGKAKYCFCC